MEEKEYQRQRLLYADKVYETWARLSTEKQEEIRDQYANGSFAPYPFGYMGTVLERLGLMD